MAISEFTTAFFFFFYFSYLLKKTRKKYKKKDWQFGFLIDDVLIGGIDVSEYKSFEDDVQIYIASYERKKCWCFVAGEKCFLI